MKFNPNIFVSMPASVPMPLRGGDTVSQARKSCGAGWQPARRLATGAFWSVLQASGRRVNNPPQVANLPHKLSPIPRPQEVDGL
jgi:hypothetical protein